LDAGKAWTLERLGRWKGLDAGKAWTLERLGRWKGLDAGTPDLPIKWGAAAGKLKRKRPRSLVRVARAASSGGSRRRHATKWLSGLSISPNVARQKRPAANLSQIRRHCRGPTPHSNSCRSSSPGSRLPRRHSFRPSASRRGIAQPKCMSRCRRRHY
jgi:hypothetical protein